MTIIIPEDYEDLNKIKQSVFEKPNRFSTHVDELEMRNLEHKPTMNELFILSPFMYMNYEDAVKKTCEILMQYSLVGAVIVDCTGLTVDVYNMVKDNYFFDSNKKIDDVYFFIIYYNKQFDQFIFLNSEDRDYVLQKDIHQYRKSDDSWSPCTLRLFEEEMFKIINKEPSRCNQYIYHENYYQEKVLVVLELKYDYAYDFQSKNILSLWRSN